MSAVKTIEPYDAEVQALANVVLNGDLSRLSPADKVEYYRGVCKSVGLNPFTQPFAYTKLNGKEVLYANKSCAEQLRQIHGVSIHVVDKRIDDDLFIVTVQARNAAGREDEDVAAVVLGQLKGEARANAIMKCMTKAKRRVTLSFCGLGMLDESEVESVHTIDAERPKHVAIATPQPPDREAQLAEAERIMEGRARQGQPDHPELGGDNIDHILPQKPDLDSRVRAVMAALTNAKDEATLSKVERKAMPLMRELEQAGSPLLEQLQDHMAETRSSLPSPPDYLEDMGLPPA